MKIKLVLLFFIVVISSFSKKKTSPSIALPKSYSAFVKTSFHQIKLNPFLDLSNNIDTASLKNSDWFANAINDIKKREYYFSSTKEANVYQNINSKNNLSFTYRPLGFSMSPIEKKFDWNVSFVFNKQVVSNGTWHIQNERAEFVNNDVTIQYINNEVGMRQNFIVHQPLQKNGSLMIDFSVQTNLEITHSKTGIQFYDHKKNILNYDGLKVWDANHKILTAYFQQNRNKEFAIVVDTKEAIYPITIDPISSTPTHTLEQNQASSNFGYSVSSAGDVNGDGYSDVIVGARNFTNGQLNEGVAFLYYGSINGINTSSFTLIEANQAGAEFGRSVSTAGDVNGDGYSDVIVGAASYSNGQINEGAVYIYHGSPIGINTIAASIVESNQVNAFMGHSVACAGDVNGDSYSDIIVGSWLYDNGESNEGAVFIFQGSTTGINPSFSTFLESNLALGYLGYSVGGAGDVNGDGYSDIIIGARGYTNLESDEGAAYIYYGSATGIIAASLVIKESNLIGAVMGTSVACAGDINGDGYSDVMIGAEFYSNGQTSEGAVYFYMGSVAGIATNPSTIIESNIASALMGRSVACAGDINGDGYSDILIGAVGYQNGEVNEGAFYIYNGSASGINTTPTIKESNQANAYMGHSVSSAGDVNGDGYSDVIVGAYLFDNGQTDEGVVFTYFGSAATITSTPNVVLENADQNSAFSGYSVASAGDINGDGYSDVLVSVYSYNEIAIDIGRVFVYHGSPTGVSINYNYIIDETDQGIAEFGKSVSSAGDINGDGYADVIIGAPKMDLNNTNEGAAYIYYGSSSGLNLTSTVLDPTNQNDAEFGNSVASAGDLNGDGFADVVIGAYRYDVGASIDAGRAYVYYGSSTGIQITPGVIIDESANQGSLLGNSVAGIGDVNGDGFGDLAIGAQFYSVTFIPSQSAEGRVYIYYGSFNGIGTIANLTLQGENAVGAAFGTSVNCAGDVNGDGFHDLIVGAIGFDDGAFIEEGRAYVFYGSTTGLNNSARTILDPLSQAVANFGCSVASLGDINADGYSDVIVGSYLFNSAFTDQGMSFIFLGSASGISITPSNSFTHTTHSNSWFGFSVASAGDVNGDGVSDVLVGAPFSNGINSITGLPISREGKTFIYYGNAGTENKRNNPRVYLNDLTTIYNSNTGTNQTTFGIGLFSKNFLGRSKGKIVWETKLNFNAFNGNPVNNSTFYTAQQNSYSDLGTSGTELKNVVDKILSLHSFTKIRVRTKYDPVTAITGQVYGPWRSVQENLTGSWLGALPVELNHFSAQWIQKGQTSQINFKVSNENNMCCYDIEKSSDGIQFRNITTIQAINQINQHTYQFTDFNAVEPTLFYRLKMQARNGQIKYSTIINLKNNPLSITISPNPAKDYIRLSLNNIDKNNEWKIFNLQGQTVLSGKVLDGNQFNISIQSIAKGMYTLQIVSKNKQQSIQFVKE